MIEIGLVYKTEHSAQVDVILDATVNALKLSRIGYMYRSGRVKLISGDLQNLISQHSPRSQGRSDNSSLITLYNLISY